MKTTLSFFSALVLTLSLSAQNYKVRECVIENSILKEVEVEYNSSTGDKHIMVNGVKTNFQTFAQASKEYANSATWYINNESIKFNGSNYVKYGLPRILGVNEIERKAAYKGIGVYTEVGFKGPIEVIYIPVRHGCEFQPYQIVLPECGIVFIKPSPKQVKVGQDVSFTVSVSGAKTPLTYSWSSLGMNVSTENNTVKFSGKVNEYEKELYVNVYVNGKGCSSAKSVSIPIVK